MSKTIKISEQTARNLAEFSKILGKSQQVILQKALEEYIREQFIKKANEEEKKLMKNKKKWKEYQEKPEAWDILLSDK